jgi:ferredoxin
MEKVGCVGYVGCAGRAGGEREAAGGRETPAAADTHSVRVLQSDEVYPCRESETLLQGMARLGRRGIPAGCLNGGCGVCKVAIRKGGFRKTGGMSRAHVSEQEESQGIVLACRVMPIGSIELDVLGKMQRSVFGLKFTCASR